MALTISLLVVAGLLCLGAATETHNITRILANHPSFSTFNRYLTATHVADEINRRSTITVCVVDNAAMNVLLGKNLSLPTITNILSLHVFADYFGAEKLHQLTTGSTTTASLFQATGEADGASGYINITDMRGGKVGFSTIGGAVQATFVKSVEELPYDIAVIQISHVLSSPEAEALTGDRKEMNATSLMAKQGCKEFSDLILRQGVGDFFETVHGGLTVFCPSSEALKSFMPKYESLTEDGKASLLLYHGVLIYKSLGMLRSSNGLIKTLATEGAKKYDFTVQNDGDDVKLETEVVTATITGTLIDEDPLAVFKIDRVLQPTELFKAAASSKGSNHESSDQAGGGNAAADETSDGGIPIVGCGFLAVAFGSVVSILFGLV